MSNFKGYEHTPLIPSDGWRCLYHARCRLSESRADHPEEAFQLLEEAQRALIYNREINLEFIWPRKNTQASAKWGGST